MIQDAIRKRSLLDWFIITICATFTTIGLYKDHQAAGEPLFWHVVPIAWVAMFIICWIVIEVINPRG